MSFLARLLSLITIPILNWVYSKLAALAVVIFQKFAEWEARREAKAKIEAKNQAILEKTEKAVTKEQRDNAARDVINDI
jgi:hypothetical protein